MTVEIDMNEPDLSPAKAPRAARATRKDAERKRSWQPPSLLPDPTPEEGYAFRWVRTATLGTGDPTNISGRLREGWEPVKASDHPELQVAGVATGQFKDCVEIGGLLLCKMPAEFVEQRNEYYKQQAESQMQSVDNHFMSQSDKRMPLFRERQSKVSFGKGS